MEQLVTIQLFGHPYTFKADSEVGKARRVADALVRKVAEIEAQRTGPTSQTVNLKVMILAALNIANENNELKSECADLVKALDERFRRLEQLIDTGLGIDTDGRRKFAMSGGD